MERLRRLKAIKRRAVAEILPNSESIDERYWPTVYSFAFSYSVGRMVIETAKDLGLEPQDAQILIVGAWGGRDWHWLTGFGFRPSSLDLHHHPWAPTTFVGDACAAATWAAVPAKYDLIVLCDVLEHLVRDFDALCYARDALNPDGVLLLSVPFRHDSEPSHIRNYSDATLRRLLAAAGYAINWSKQRPGLLETMPSFVQTANYVIALLAPSPEAGGRLMARLLSWEYQFNERTREIFRILGRSPQKGIIYSCRRADVIDNIGIQKLRHR